MSLAGLINSLRFIVACYMIEENLKVIDVTEDFKITTGQ